MNTRDLISDFETGPGDARQALLAARLLLSYLADHVYVAEPKLNDATDFKHWLQALANEAQHIANFSKEENWEDTCNRCGHIHEGMKECGFCVPGAGVCKCEFEIVTPRARARV
jgi:hypothetical protein